MEKVTLSQPMSYVVACARTGAVLQLVTAPKRALPSGPDAGQKIIVITDGNLPKHSQYVLKLDMLSEPVTYVEQFADIVATDGWPTRGDNSDLEVRRCEIIAEIDRSYAERLAAVAGPLMSLHTEKRRQAEAGGGPLVMDEADRLAILVNAARQDEAIAEIERQRRAIKTLLRNARTDRDIAAALALIHDDNRKPI